jgi:hypothetical protein
VRSRGAGLTRTASGSVEGPARLAEARARRRRATERNGALRFLIRKARRRAGLEPGPLAQLHGLCLIWEIQPKKGSVLAPRAAYARVCDRPLGSSLKISARPCRTVARGETGVSSQRQSSAHKGKPYICRLSLFAVPRHIVSSISDKKTRRGSLKWMMMRRAAFHYGVIAGERLWSECREIDSARCRQADCDRFSSLYSSEGS